MNCFRQTHDNSLDRKFLRVSTVYRLMRKGIIGKARALELLAQRHSQAEMKSLSATVDLWLTTYAFRRLAKSNSTSPKGASL